MDFSLDEGQQEVRQFGRDVLGRCAAQAPPAGDTDPADALWDVLARSDFLALGLSEKWGGSGGGTIETSLLCEQVGRSGLTVPYDSWAPVAGALSRLGTDAQRGDVLPRVVSGELRLTHPSTDLQSDVDVPTLRADSDGLLLTGVVRHVPVGRGGAHVLLPARLAERDGALALALVDTAAPGVSTETVEVTDSSAEAHLRFDGVRLEQSDLYATGEGGVAWAEIRLHAVAATCASQLGACTAALEMAARHCAGREQFGQSLGRFQAVTQRLADAYIDLQVMEVSVWRLVSLLDDGPSTNANTEAAAALAKHLSARLARNIIRAAVHLHGGLGVDVTYPLARLVTSSKRLELRLGGAGHHLAVLAELLGTAEDLDELLLA